MSILEIAEELRDIAERNAKERNKTVKDVWEESVKELNEIYKESENRFMGE